MIPGTPPRPARLDGGVRDGHPIYFLENVHQRLDVQIYVAKSCKKLYLATMANARKVSARSTSSGNRAGSKIPVTLRLDADRFKRLEILARAENRTVTNFVETAVLRDLEAKEEAARVITMFVPPEAAALTPGPLVRTEGESDERYAERSALMDVLFSIPDSE